LAASDGAEAAEELLLSLGEKFREDKSPELRPNSESFSLVIRAWIQQARHHPDMNVRVQALHRAVEWLGSLREVEVEGGLSTAPELFLGVLRAAETCCVLRPDVLELAEKTLHDYRNSWFQVDHKAYTSVLLIGLQVLSGPEDAEARRTFLTPLLARCSEDGLVSSAFVREIFDFPAFDREERLLITNEIFPEWPLPSSWTRNLLPKFRPKPNDIKRDNFKTKA
jgi:hypothetical protein